MQPAAKYTPLRTTLSCSAPCKSHEHGLLTWPATLDFFAFFKGPESAVIRHFHYLDADTGLDEDLAALSLPRRLMLWR